MLIVKDLLNEGTVNIKIRMDMSKIVIIINGKKRSGKDNFAKILKREYSKLGKSVMISAFADPIREILSKSLNISTVVLDGFKNAEFVLSTKDPETGKTTDLVTFREFYQKFGTDAMHSYFGKNVWVDLLNEKIESSTAEVIIIPDFRFPHEEISDISIQVFDSNIISEDSHISENSLNDLDFKFEVDNTDHPDLTKAAQDIILRIAKIRA